ncbi:MAG: guanylate kinase [Candidatus Zixiibacteriota bacterium]|nr:MAG: guanylate kinase [candidate division Zixibacteria bacterium]
MSATPAPLCPGRFVVLSSPSGGGKNTVIQRLLAKYPHFAYSVSATTRPPRPGEEDGKPYWFISREEFLRRLEAGDLLEWEEVYGDLYGTPRGPAEAAIAEGRCVLFDLDVKGALRVKQVRPDSILIFLEPPSLAVLEDRLRRRGTDSEERICKRLAQAQWECNQASRFDYRVVNDRLEETIQAVERIIEDYLKEDKHS